MWFFDLMELECTFRSIVLLISYLSHQRLFITLHCTVCLKILLHCFLVSITGSRRSIQEREWPSKQKTQVVCRKPENARWRRKESQRERWGNNETETTYRGTTIWSNHRSKIYNFIIFQNELFPFCTSPCQ